MNNEVGIRGIDHVAVAVEDLDAALNTLEKVLGLRASHRERIDGYGVDAATVSVGETAIELIAGTSGDSPISRHVARHGPGIHHIAVGVANIESAIDAVAASGAQMIDQAPRTGKDDSQVAFVHPRSTLGVLFELVEPRRQEP